jgi:DNA topoisomerase-1
MARKAAAKGVLVLVESPAKGRTIERCLGEGHRVLATMGHLIDLPRSRLGVDTEGGFEPEYLTVRGKAGLLKEIKRAAGKSRLVLIACDNDREGEALAWQLRKALEDSRPGLPVERIVFNELTPAAVREALAHPRGVDEGKVMAQKARRVLDRLVGYHLSPLLWRKLKNGLSAGRVQSVALRLICEREREVEGFIPEEYRTVEARFRKGRATFAGELVSWRGAKPRLAREADARALIGALGDTRITVAEIRHIERIQRPKAPFTTAQLLQEAANRLGFTGKKTTQVAQQLYEGVDPGDGPLGLITFMRSATTRVSEAALAGLRAYVSEAYPAELPAEPNVHADNGGTEAHEAIRPTDVTLTPDRVKDSLTRDQHRLYSLIWERFVASQMTPARRRTIAIDAAAGKAVFRISSSRFLQRGFRKVLKLSADAETREAKLPSLEVGEELRLESLEPAQHFTQGPERYTDATIIKALEDGGLGRPSTYAPTLSVLLERFYITRDKRQILPTALGRMVNDIIVESFPTIVDPAFTAAMEARLDEVEKGRADWSAMIGDFYPPFKLRFDEVMEGLESRRGSLDEATGLDCELCGKPLVKRLGRSGFFLACSGFPACRNTRSIPLATCPACGKGDIVAKRKADGKGRTFYGCTRYPDCGFVTYHRPTAATCPKCGHFLVERSDRKRGHFKVCVNPACDCLHDQEDGAAPAAEAQRSEAVNG